MRKALKWVGIVLGVVVGVIILAVAAVYILSSVRFNKTYDVTPSTVDLPTDSAAVDHGRHLAIIRGCTECHGPDLAGRVLISDPAFGTLYSANLTSGKGGVGAEFSDADFFNVLETWRGSGRQVGLLHAGPGVHAHERSGPGRHHRLHSLRAPG